MNMKNNNILVAAYGTLREGYGNNRLIPEGSHIGKGKTLERYTMTSSGIPFVSKTPTTQIVVDVYSIDEDTLKRLDRLEGHPDWYEREIIPIVMDDSTVLNAWLYFNNDYEHLPVVITGDYSNKIPLHDDV